VLGTVVVLFLARPGLGMPVALRMTPATALVVMLVAAFLGLVSALVPSYRASNLGIVDALRHIG